MGAVLLRSPTRTSHNYATVAQLQLSRHTPTATSPMYLLIALDSEIAPPGSRLLEMATMNDKLDQDTSQASDQLHPFVYAALAGLALCLVVSAWLFFSQGGYLGLDLGIVSALLFMIIAIPTVLYFVGRRFQAADRASSIARPFSTWIAGDFDMRQGRRKSVSAAIEILLPMTAAVIGITAIGIVFRLAEVGSYWL